MLHDAQRTSAPNACRVSISTAGWIFSCSLPAMRGPRNAASGANSPRIAISPGISVSAIAISFRPQSASSRSATLKSLNCAVSVTAFIVSLRSYRATRGAQIESFAPVARESRFNERRCMGMKPAPSLARRAVRTAAGCNAPRNVGIAIISSTDKRSGFRGEQRVGKTRFALVEAFGVKRLLQRKQLVVEVMAELMHERAQKCLERDDLPPRSRAHPDGDPRPRSAFLRLIEAVQLAVIAGRALRQDAHPYRRNLVAVDERIDQ